ncbi:MAG TPA: hypothetical protein VJ949_04995 [Cryomorphaceae bacterium]|nr:hypothetical protein [Cryomorphaceae bacterium]
MDNFKPLFYETMRAAFFLFLILVLPSCATIVSNSRYPVYIDSNPTEARLTVTNRKGEVVYQGHTPKTLKLDASNGYFSRAIYTIKFEHEDFVSSTVRLEATVDGWYFGNFLFAGLIGFLVVDPLTGAMYKIEEPAIYEKLHFEGYQGLHISPFEDLPSDLRENLVQFEVPD